jgi:hypothetical protein
MGHAGHVTGLIHDFRTRPGYSDMFKYLRKVGRVSPPFLAAPYIPYLTVWCGVTDCALHVFMAIIPLAYRWWTVLLLHTNQPVLYMWCLFFHRNYCLHSFVTEVQISRQFSEAALYLSLYSSVKLSVCSLWFSETLFEWHDYVTV